MLTLLVVLLILVVFVALAAVCLRLGGRWVKAPRATLGRAFAAQTVGALLLLLLLPLSLVGQQVFGSFPAFVLPAAAAVAALVLTWLVVGRLLRVSFGKAILAWLPTLLAGGAVAALVLLIVRPYVF
jgi:hypothetical protein